MKKNFEKNTDRFERKAHVKKKLIREQQRQREAEADLRFVGRADYAFDNRREEAVF